MAKKKLSLEVKATLPPGEGFPLQVQELGNAGGCCRGAGTEGVEKYRPDLIPMILLLWLTINGDIFKLKGL